MNISVSIGIPVYNEERNLDNLLQYIHSSKFNFNLKEIIIVCSGCTDNSLEVARRWKTKQKKIRLIVEKVRRGKLYAMNKILKFSRGDNLIFVNADTLPQKNALNFIMKHFQNPQIGAVTGRPMPLQKADTIAGYFQNFIWDLHHEISFTHHKITGELFAVKRNLIKKIPVEIINDDAYYAGLIFPNHSIKYEPRAKTFMIESLNLKNYIKKRRRIAQGFQQLSELDMNVSVPIFLLTKILLRKMMRKPKQIPKMFAVIIIEIYCNLMAFLDIRRGKMNYIWDKANVA